MSRSGYTDEPDSEWQLMYRGRVASALRGKRGQAFLRELLAALDAMPEKALITDALVCERGVCAIGAVAQYRGIDVSGVDPEASDYVASLFDIAEAMACEIAYLNDEHWAPETPHQRWQRMRDWCLAHLKEPTHAD